MGLEITAEGIETKEQEDYLEKRGCHSAQGWLFGKPMPISELIEIYRKPARIIVPDSSDRQEFKIKNEDPLLSDHRKSV